MKKKKTTMLWNVVMLLSGKNYLGIKFSIEECSVNHGFSSEISICQISLSGYTHFLLAGWKYCWEIQEKLSFEKVM